MSTTKKTTIALSALLISVFFQVICAIQGFDLTDEGALMSSYQWFGIDPQAAKCGTGYPLSCYLGSLIMSLNYAGGILWVRLAGVALVTTITICVFFFLKKRIAFYPLILGLLGMTFFLAGDPKPFGYNSVTAALAVIITILTIWSQEKKSYLLMAIAGFVGGISIFFRLPNVVFAGFAILPFIVEFRRPIREIPKNCYLFALAYLVLFVAGAIVGWLWVVKIGADQQIKEFFSSVNSQLQGDSSHNIFIMLFTYFMNYLTSLIYPFWFLVCILLFDWCLYLKNKWVRFVLAVVCIILAHQIVYNYHDILGEKVEYFFNGIALCGCLYFLIKEKGKRALTAGALLMSVLAPLGSDQGFVTMWIGPFLAFPIGLAGYQAILAKYMPSEKETYGLKVNLYHNTKETSLFKGDFALEALKKTNTSFLICGLFVVLCIAKKVDYRVYYDPGLRTEKTSSIQAPLAKGIYTFKEKTRIINPLLKQLRKVVKPGDELLVYNFSPLLNYLTETKPYAGISWPCVYYGQRYVNELDKELKKGNPLPVIVRQHFISCNDWDIPMSDYDKIKGFNDKVQHKYFKMLVKKYNYKKIWTNTYYDILVPQKPNDGTGLLPERTNDQ